MKKRQVVIIGGNFAGLSAASQLAAQVGKGGQPIAVTVIDPRAEFSWTPNIHQLLSGVRHTRELILSRRQLLSAMGHGFIQARVTEFSGELQALRLDNGSLLSFDACLIACGHEAALLPRLTAEPAEQDERDEQNKLGEQDKQTGQADSSAPWPLICGFRTPQDASQLNQAIEQRLVASQGVQITLVGGGFTGIEALGELLRRYREQPAVSIRLLEPGPRLLPGQFPEVAKDVMQLAEACGTEFCFGVRAQAVGEQGVVLDDGRELASDIVICTSGGRLPAFLRHSDLVPGHYSDTALLAEEKVDSEAAEMPLSGIAVSQTLQSLRTPAVFVAGDAAALAVPVRKQSYHALAMGKRAGDNLQRWLNGHWLEPFHPAAKPLLLSFGSLNSYLIFNRTVLASPLLDTLKEAVWQLMMARLSLPLPVMDVGLGAGERAWSSLAGCLDAELSVRRLLQILQQSRLLHYGGHSDLLRLLQATLP